MAKLLQMPFLFEELAPSFPQDEQPEAKPAQGSSTQIADAAERERALDIRGSWIVEAPAGSGKTGLLIQRYLKLLAYGGVEHPDEVLAITFTRKADAEMRRRVLEELAAAGTNKPLPADAGAFERSSRELALAALSRDKQSGWHLLDNPQQLNIRTIDSFCAELAGSMPLTAGPGGRYAPAEDASSLYEVAAQRTLLHLGGTDPTLTQDLETLLLHRDANPGDFVRLVADMLRQRDEWGELVPLDLRDLTDEALDQHVRPRLTSTLQRLIGQELQAVADLIGPHLLDELATLAHRLSACTPYNGDPSPVGLCAERPEAPKPAAADLKHWACLTHLLLKADGDWRTRLQKNDLRFETSPIQRQELQYLIAAFQDRASLHPGLREALCDVRNLPSPEYPDDQWRIVKALCRTLRHALLELQIIFAERGACDFTEVALSARSLLRSDGSAADVLHTSVARLKHLLVDEMQDTSAGQYELLEAVTHSWDGATQTLFLVGDPKQSIYEFRQARVERFVRVATEGTFGRLPLGSLRLTANFRSQATLVEALNGTFDRIFPSAERFEQGFEAGDVPFIAASATRSARPGPALHWHASEDLPSDPVPAPTEDAGSEFLAPTPAAHARAIRERIEAFLRAWESRSGSCGETQHPPKIAVLARNRAHLAPVIQEFHRDRGQGPLAFHAVDIEALNERPEVLDLLALTRALLHPADRVAWLSVLHSPVCGLALPDLLLLTGEGPDADAQHPVPCLIRSRAHLLSVDGQAHLRRAWAVLEQALANAGRTSLSTEVERTWRSLGGDLFLEPHEQANSRRFFELLQKLEAGPEPISLTLLTRALKRLYAQPTPGDARVELMTIHKAKGLEWDLVLIPSLHRGSGRNGPQLLKWLEFDSPEGTAEFLLAPIQSKGDESSSLSKWLDRRQRRREAAEAKRLFYVACTRAREELHLFATVERKRDGSLARPVPDSLLAAAWPAAEPIIAEQIERSSRSAELIPFRTEDPGDEVLALAAAAETAEDCCPPANRGTIRRLSLRVDPLARFRADSGAQLPYPPVESLRREASFARPEGSFGARAFGNTIHRFLPLISARLAGGQPAPSLLAELPSWQARLQTALRNEGLSPAQANAEASRALTALSNTLRDPDGLWLLAPHPGARDEAPIQSLGGKTEPSLRADRSFLAGRIPQGDGEPDHLWIIDYKTPELGGRVTQDFLAAQRDKYLPQMQAYAKAAIAQGHAANRIILALYLPLLPALVHWPADDSYPHGQVTYVPRP